ncbi:SMI1/KNR4 family protein [Actinacidiphila sp. bgisy167]|uniref:SMI1/KNR4 family protein n=1 Tax=Actinacidiphila sp. bgisy167 TaxID=3413797 RepID=UPI003D70FE41
MTVPEWLEFLTAPGTDWPGTLPANEGAVRAVEQRLGLSLPPSYRNFLLVSDGWEEMPTNAGTLRTADAIGWYPETDPEMWTAWFGPDMDFPDLESALRRCVLITTDSVQGDVWVLSADHIGANGEWRAYEWWPGDDGSLLPHDSFGSLLLSARDAWVLERAAEA